MRALLLSTVALAAISSTAIAADLPSRAAPPVAPVYAPVFTWTGLYVGLNAGVGWADDTNVFITDSALGSTNLSVGTDAGFVGGGQIGYNFQTGAFVFGIEADIQYADLSAKANWSGYTWWANRGSDSQYFGTVRARAGYAFDRVLVYVTGGLAYGGLNDSWWGSDTQTGWTLGGGVEYAFTNNWTAKIEGLYVDLDQGSHTETVFLGGGRTVTATSGSSQGGGLVRVGVNYKF